MKKRFLLTTVAALALSITAGGCAKEKSPSRSPHANQEAAGKERTAAGKVGVKWFSGKIEALDVAAGTLTLKGPKGTRNFRADQGAKKDLSGRKIGDKVIVKHTGEVARSVVKPGGNYNHHATRGKEFTPREVGPGPESKG